METYMTRRNALKGIAAMATLQILPSHILNARTAPSNQLTNAIIGCGGVCGKHLNYPGKLLALCDVDSKLLQKRINQARKKHHTDIKGYAHFEEVIDRDDVDIIHVATPPHWHAYMSIAAAKAGKDIWCEKPMSRTIGEGIAMVKAVEAENRIFRINTRFRFDSDFHNFKRPATDVWKVVHHKLLGDGPYTINVGPELVGDWKLDRWSGKTDLKEEPIPEHLNYDKWLGPAPMKPYNALRVHRHFRGYWDYDGGGLGDMGQHFLDPSQFVLGKDEESPVFVEVDTQPQHHDAVLPWRRIELVYADGCKIILNAEASKTKKAPILSGPKGNVYAGFTSDISDFEKKVKELPGPPPMITDFHQSIRERKKFALNHNNGFRSCTIVNIAKIALRENRPLRFDSEKLKFTDDELANTYINQPARGKYEV